MNNIIPIQTELSFKVRELATDTRNESYITLDEGDVEYWHKRMIEAYKKYGNLCDHYMRQIIGLEIHLVSARRNDLTKPYYIEKYGFMVTAWLGLHFGQPDLYTLRLNTNQINFTV